MQKIVPYLWFDKEAAEAAQWYVDLVGDSRILSIATIPGTPSGDTEVVDFQLLNLRISAMSAGPFLKFNPAGSLMVSCSTKEEVARLTNALSPAGQVLMPLDSYPFSPRYAWIQDKYGLGWQLMFSDTGAAAPQITPCLLFAGDACGKAEEALDYYVAIFKDSEKGLVSYYRPGEAADTRAQINYAEVKILGTRLIAMDHGFGGDFTFNEAFSLMVLCETQAEIDYYWEKLSFVPKAEQCGWLKDRFGLSWQIVPRMMTEIWATGTKEEMQRVTAAFLKMKKFDLAALEKARLG